MTKNIFLSVFAVLVLFNALSAQTHKCGVTYEMGKMIKEQMIQNRNEMRDYVSLRSGNVYLPVRFYLVAKSDGTDRPSEDTALDGLCNLNNNFADQEIQFYLKEFKYLNNTQLHSNPGSGFAYSTLNQQIIYNAINIFIVGNAGSGVAAFWQPPAGPAGDDWIVSSASYADDFETLTHEVGHFFSLNHPFYGWESEGWNLADHGNPVGLFSPDGELNEFVDGTNCNEAGDMICDTPADYRFEFPGPDGCTYNLDVMDPNGDLLEPDMTNFMNYASCANSAYHFTDMQKVEVQNSLNSSSRNYIPKNYVPNIDPIEDIPTLLSPQQAQTIETYNYVTLEWTPVDNAESYMLIVVGTTSGQRLIITDDTAITLTDLEPESNYFWKVKPFNEYSVCQNFSAQRFFKTGTDVASDTNEIPELADWYLSPNPVRSGESIQLNVEVSNGLTADVIITNIAGQLVEYIENQEFGTGITNFEIPTANLPSGIYMVSLRTLEGMETQRISIL